jgi:hypothetical protein
MDGEARDTDVVGTGALDAADAAEPEIFDPDEPTPAVGSWPSLDPRRLGLPPLAWLFVAAAVFVGWRSITMYAGAPLELGPLVNAAIGTMVGVFVLLVPAALLRRVPDAPGRLPLLFAGLALEGLLWVLSPYGVLWAAEGDPLATILPLVTQALAAASAILVGLGLLRLRGRRPDRFGLLAAMALVYVAGVLGEQAVLIGPGSMRTDPMALAQAVVWFVPAAFAVWVPVAAWLDREPPRRFWALLAAPFALWVVAIALGVAANLVTREQFGAVAADLGWVVYSLVWATPSLLAFIAYGWLTPRPSRPADTVPGGAPMPLAPA